MIFDDPTNPPRIGHGVAKRYIGAMGPDEWQAYRSGLKSIGSSTASVVMGANKWKSPFELSREMRGRHQNTFSGNDFTAIGSAIEPYIRRFASRHLGQPCVEVPFTWAHPYQPFMTCNLDGVIDNGTDRPAIIEIKWGNYKRLEMWQEFAKTRDLEKLKGTSIHCYYIQVQHQLAVMGLDEAVLFGVIGEKEACKMFAGVDPDPSHTFILDIKRDDAVIEEIEQKCREFWERFVLQDVDPPLSASDEGFFNEAYPRSVPGREIDAPHLEEKVVKYQELKKDYQAVDRLIKKTRAEIKEAMGDAEKASAGSKSITWKTDKNGVRRLHVR